MTDGWLAERGGRTLREALALSADGHALPESGPFLDLQSVLERLVPAILGWKHESLDGFRFAAAKRLSAHDAECCGLCLLISDQTWTPFHLRLALRPGDDSVHFVECRVGERDQRTGKMVRVPYGASRVSKDLVALPQRLESVSWVYDLNQPRAPESI